MFVHVQWAFPLSLGQVQTCRSNLKLCSQVCSCTGMASDSSITTLFVCATQESHHPAPYLPDFPEGTLPGLWMRAAPLCVGTASV